MSQSRFHCPQNDFVFFPFYKSINNLLTIPYNCRGMIDDSVPVYVRKSNKNESNTILNIIYKHKYRNLIYLLIVLSTTFLIIGILLYMYSNKIINLNLTDKIIINK